MIATVLAMLLAADPATPPTRPPARIVLPIVDKAASCAEVPSDIGCPERAQSRFRLPLAQETAPTSKDRAMAETGQECQLVGARMCTSNGRKLLSTPLSNGTQP